MRLIAPAFVTLALAGIGSGAQAQTLKVDYDISLAGLPMGSAAVSSTFTKSKYRVEGTGKLSGLARILTGGKGGASSSGTFSGARFQSAGFTITAKSSSQERTVRMDLKGGQVSSISIEPPYDERPDRIPVKEADKRGVVDPVSALLMPVASAKGPMDPANCDRTLPIFDGAMRFDVILSYAETKDDVAVQGYSGPVLVCNARFVPISGHRPERAAIKFMQDNRDMSVWLAPVEGQQVLFPLRISVRTMIGTSVIEASNWSLEGAAKAAPASRRASRVDPAVKAGMAQ